MSTIVYTSVGTAGSTTASTAVANTFHGSSSDMRNADTSTFGGAMVTTRLTTDIGTLKSGAERLSVRCAADWPLSIVNTNGSTRLVNDTVTMTFSVVASRDVMRALRGQLDNDLITQQATHANNQLYRQRAMLLSVLAGQPVNADVRPSLFQWWIAGIDPLSNATHGENITRLLPVSLPS